MKSEWDKLRDKYNEDVDKLQNSCSHSETEFVEFQWAPGHIDGIYKVCKRCHKRLDRI